MAYMFVTGPCLTCGKIFSFNPNKVPSLRVNGVREPICETCITLANKERERMGNAPHPIHPEAYEAEEVE